MSNGTKRRRKTWQANKSFLKRIQKTAFASNSVYVRGLNIRDLAKKKKNLKAGKKASRLPLSQPLLSAHLQVSWTVVRLLKTKSGQNISDATHLVFFHTIQRDEGVENAEKFKEGNFPSQRRFVTPPTE